MTKILIDRAVVEQTLEALWTSATPKSEDAITALRAALAEPVQEPVVNHYESDLDMVKCRQIAREYAWPNSNIDSGNLYWALHVALRHVAPPQRPAEPVTDKCICNHTPLTDDQLDDIAVAARRGNLYDLRIAIERALKIGGKE